MSELHRISGCDDPRRAADVVFVHGLGGDAFGTWRHGKDESTSWPHWLGAEFPQVGVWSVGYAASPTKWAWISWLLGGETRDTGHALPLTRRAHNLLDQFGQHEIGKRPVLFVCHSLGGLVTKAVLRASHDGGLGEQSKLLFRNTRAIYFLATPHNGAFLASFLNRLGALITLKTVAIEDLREHNAQLEDLFNWCRKHAQEAGIATFCYYETRKVKGFLPIVNSTSAQSGWGPNAVGLEEDHLSIAKPQKKGARVCDKAREILRDFVLQPRPVVPAGPPTPVPSLHVAHTQEHRPPLELPKSPERFVGRKDQRAALIERLRAGKNTSVVGPAGLGKTALAASALLEVVGSDPARLGDCPFPDGVVLLDLYGFHGDCDAAWDSLATQLRGLHFEERARSRVRAQAACVGKRFLLLIEGGEEASGLDGRKSIPELLSVLSTQNRWLLLTRDASQTIATETIPIQGKLETPDDGDLFDFHCGGSIQGPLRGQVLRLLEGHPLAITWAGGLLARGDEDPKRLIQDWGNAGLLGLHDPLKAEHTLEWLYARSVSRLDTLGRRALQVAGSLAHRPFPTAGIQAGLGAEEEATRVAVRSLVRHGLLRRAQEDDAWEFTHIFGYGFARKTGERDSRSLVETSRWLIACLQRELKYAESSPEIGRLLEHSAAVLQLDGDQVLWESLAELLLFDIVERLTDLGRLGEVGRALLAVEAWMEGFTPAKTSESGWMRERSVLQARQGYVLCEQGDLDGALEAFRQSLAVRQRLAAADASKTTWQRDVSVSLNNVGNVLREQGDLDGALETFRQSLAVSQRLAAADASNTTWQRDVSVSLNNVGNVLCEQGDLDGALEAFRQSLALSQRLAVADASNMTWQRDVSVSQDNVGNVLREQGDLDGALEAFVQSLARRQRLAAADASNTTWQRDVSISLNNVGNVLRQQGDLDKALEAFEQSLAVKQRLAAADASNTTWQRDLSISLTNIAQVVEKQGDGGQAIAYAEESLAIDRRLAALDPTNATWKRDVRISEKLVARLRGKAAGG